MPCWDQAWSVLCSVSCTSSKFPPVAEKGRPLVNHCQYHRSLLRSPSFYVAVAVLIERTGLLAYDNRIYMCDVPAPILENSLQRCNCHWWYRVMANNNKLYWQVRRALTYRVILIQLKTSLCYCFLYAFAVRSIACWTLAAFAFVNETTQLIRTASRIFLPGTKSVHVENICIYSPRLYLRFVNNT